MSLIGWLRSLPVSLLAEIEATVGDADFIGTRECGPTSLDVGYEASEEGSAAEDGSITVQIFPMLLVNINQPHMFVQASNEKQKLDISFYDAGVNLSPQKYFLSGGGYRLPDVMDFPTFWFQTKQGDQGMHVGRLAGRVVSCQSDD